MTALGQTLGLAPDFLGDLEVPNAVLAIGRARASPAGDLVLLATGPDSRSCEMAFNAIRMLRKLNLDKHTVLVADSPQTCERLKFEGCYWTSRLLYNAPATSVSMQKFWDWRFRFYFIKKQLMAKFVDAGFGVLQCDTDTIWKHDPFPTLHGIASTVVVQQDAPLANAGIMYARPGIASKLLLHELAYRIQLFQNHPDVAVPRIVPFVKSPPYYGNSDDQTMLNDVIVSLTLNNRSFLISTARFEAASRHNKEGPSWSSVPESKISLARIHATRKKGVTRQVTASWGKGSRLTYWAFPVFGTNDSVAIAPSALFSHLPMRSQHAITHLAALSGFSKKTAHLMKIGEWDPKINDTATKSATEAGKDAARTPGPAGKDLLARLARRVGLLGRPADGVDTADASSVDPASRRRGAGGAEGRVSGGKGSGRAADGVDTDGASAVDPTSRRRGAGGAGGRLPGAKGAGRATDGVDADAGSAVEPLSRRRGAGGAGGRVAGGKGADHAKSRGVLRARGQEGSTASQGDDAALA